MATRNLLHKRHLEAFKEWLIKCGWQIHAPKGIYEALRASRGGKWLILYCRADAKEHYSVRDVDCSTVRRFFRYAEEKKAEEYAKAQAVANGWCNNCQLRIRCEADPDIVFPKNAACMVRKREILQAWRSFARRNEKWS